MIGWLGLLLLVDIAMAISVGQAQLAVPLCGVIGIGAHLLRHRFRVQGMVLLMAMSAGVSISMIAFHWAGTRGTPGFAETGSLLLLTVGVLRWVTPLRLAVLLSLLSMITLELASGLRTMDTQAVGFGFLLFVAWSTAMGIGSYLRYQRERRNETVNAVRRAERLELARELHDLVAHHITGIVVQAQAARTVAVQKPEAVVPSLDAIANAGADALTSMRRLVGVLRADDDASHRPGTTLADLRMLAERFSNGGPQVAFDIGQGITESALAPEVLTTLHRVLQESLTNVRRHAPGAGWVEADLRPVERGVLLRVRNHGSLSDPRLARLGGGFGLVGMAERVNALGGDLVAGPTPEGAWEVRAWFPVDHRPAGF
jgi:signal transduction histidine kinase